MDKHATWLACGGVATALAGAGAAADRRLGTSPCLAAVGAVAGCAYLVGTFSQASPLFGRSARTHGADGAFALTFDDGPDPRYTRRISAQLAARGHRATFFVLGRAVQRHPEVAAQLLADGHELANHGDDHRLLAFSTPRAVREQIAATERALEDATGSLPVRLFRAPHGVRSPWLARTVRSLGYRMCGWNGHVFDTAEPGVGAIVERAGRLLGPGAVVLLHDGDGSGRGGEREETVEALLPILEAAESRGLRSVPLSTLL